MIFICYHGNTTSDGISLLNTEKDKFKQRNQFNPVKIFKIRKNWAKRLGRIIINIKRHKARTILKFYIWKLLNPVEEIFRFRIHIWTWSRIVKSNYLTSISHILSLRQFLQLTCSMNNVFSLTHPFLRTLEKLWFYLVLRKYKKV